MKKTLLAFALSAASLSAFAAKLPVVASFSIVADMTREVGGERVDVVSLVGPDQDAHVYQPSPADVKRVAAARVFVANGLGFEGWMARLTRSAGFKGVTVEAASGVKTIREAGHEGHGHGHDHGDVNPHAWHDLAAAQRYVANIEAALAKADPAGRDYYRARAGAYTVRLKELDAWALKRFAAIPAARRKVLTSHDAFPYLGQRYGIRFIAPQGVSTETEASAKSVAQIVRQVKKEKVGAVFVENMADKKLLEQLSREAGVKVVGKLYADALSAPTGPAPSFAALFRHNAETLLAALQ
ncbi:zinc/manganese transport system substrate-binding protein [Crenobacter luteus]|uniref:metal ABC transporter substrate-binding protein n=1 Tax=Crenobacter luteus TaxID=1452487 RepID=UPI00104914FB|nr:metal ABC transporter substrate-binding protein [Crenobacter luteus]TCP11584.1 zinc/manganese transport system substrate-binding protein [Crenobacter luteus]